VGYLSYYITHITPGSQPEILRSWPALSLWQILDPPLRATWFIYRRQVRALHRYTLLCRVDRLFRRDRDGMAALGRSFEAPRRRRSRVACCTTGPWNQQTPQPGRFHDDPEPGVSE